MIEKDKNKEFFKLLEDVNIFSHAYLFETNSIKDAYPFILRFAKKILCDKIQETIVEKIILSKKTIIPIAIEIKNLNGRLDEYAKLDASYFIKDKNGKVIVSKDFYKASAFEGKYVEYVKTISAMLGELSDAIANDLVNIK